MNTQSNILLGRLKRAKQNRCNPPSSITDPHSALPSRVNILDSFEQRDDHVRAVVSKRKKAVGRQGWTVLIHESLPAARRAEAERRSHSAEHNRGEVGNPNPRSSESSAVETFPSCPSRALREKEILSSSFCLTFPFAVVREQFALFHLLPRSSTLFFWGGGPPPVRLFNSYLALQTSNLT
jgi:hypothetical protein